MDYITMLAKFGSVGAHPGGFAATKALLASYPLPPQSRVLEIGSGTGQTACYLAAQGHHVTATDAHEQMVDKLRKRAELHRLDIHTVQADACQQPWSDGQFDVVFFESVLNFTQVDAALAECYRVVRHGGRIIGRELMVDERIPGDRRERLRRFFGMPQLLTLQAWQQQFEQLSPAAIELLEYAPFHLHTRKSDEEEGAEFIDEGVFEDASLLRTAILHDELLYDNADYLFSGLFRITK